MIKFGVNDEGKDVINDEEREREKEHKRERETERVKWGGVG